MAEQPSAPVGSFTQLFFAGASSPPEAVAANAAPGTFTQMSQAAASGDAPLVGEGLKLRQERQGGTPEEKTVPVPSASTVPDGPVSFTQLFRALDAESGSHTAEPPPPPTAPGSFTQMFPTPPVSTPGPEPPPLLAGPAVPPTQPAGSFTQLFSTPLSSAPVAAVERAPSASPAADSFTQMFQALGVEPARPERPPAAAPAGGSFTQMFSNPAGRDSAGAAPPAEVPGSFTQMFRALDSETPQASGASSGGGGPAAAASFTQTFGSFAEPAGHPPPAQPVKSPAQATPAYAPPTRPGATPAPADAGLTELLRTLEAPGQGGVPRPVVEPVRPPVSGNPPGAFTSAYSGMGTSGLPRTVAPQGFTAQLPPVPSVSPGPSEFTRILNASALRESGMREAGIPSGGQMSQPAAPTSSQPWSVALPAMPTAPRLPSVHLPNLPTPALAAPPAGKLQQFLPLILILTILLLVAILVIFIFFMKR